MIGIETCLYKKLIVWSDTGNRCEVNESEEHVELKHNLPIYTMNIYSSIYVDRYWYRNIRWSGIYFWKARVGQHDQKTGQNCFMLGYVCLTVCLRMKLSTIIVFCCLLLGVNSQGWRTFLREAGQGKDPSIGLEEAASDPAQVSPEQRPHSHKQRSRPGRRRTLFSW